MITQLKLFSKGESVLLFSFIYIFPKWIVSVDIRENESANANIIVDPNDGFKDQETKVLEKLKPLLLENAKLDAVLNVAGGWAGE